MIGASVVSGGHEFAPKLLPRCSQMPKLDKRSVDSLPGPALGKFDVVHWDDDLPGFGLRVLASGARSWVVRYRIGAQSRVVTLGNLAARTPPDARTEAGRILAGPNLDMMLARKSRRAA